MILVMMPRSASKEDLRRWALQHRRHFSVSEVERYSARVIDHLWTVEDFRAAHHVFTCLSFDKEVDTWPLVDDLSADAGRRVYVPRVDEAGVMHVHRYPCRLRTLRMGLRQPPAEAPEVPSAAVDATIEVALVVGLAFDRRRGYRLGHGNGHFDRFLSDKSFHTIGLVFESLLVDRLPAEAHDIPMRTLVTDERVIRCQPTGASSPPVAL